MSFVIQRPAGRGVSLTQLRGDTLRIGRGTNAELRSENLAVALEHAVIEASSGGYVITDKGSITGTYVNRRPVETATLAKDDVIEIGDLRIEVQVAEPGKPLFLRIVPVVVAAAGTDSFDGTSPRAAAAPGRGTVRAKKIDYVAAYRLRRPYFTKLSVVALLCLAVIALIANVTEPAQQSAFMPGGVSSAHARAHDPNGKSIGNDCNACHDPWRGVSDAKCAACHTQAAHSELSIRETPCSECHMEHRATAKLATMNDTKCVGCHSDLRAHEMPAAVRTSVSLLAANPQLARVTSFGDQHPDFTPLADPDTLRFNHQLHLRASGILNASGKREVLQCTQCHKLVDTKGKIDPKPVRFEQDCQRCHRLTFDMRFPELEVPHGGDPGLVYGFILAAYAGNRDIAGKSPEQVRRILTSRPQGSPNESAVLNAEQVIKSKCTLCHEMRREGGRLAATPPVIRARWIEHARFAHTEHRSLDCESCHQARSSRVTSDVLMPSRNACTACHGAQSSAKTSSNCVSCHVYHERSKLLLASTSGGVVPPTAPGGAHTTGSGALQTAVGRGPMLTTILTWAAVLLVLVVLLPMGVAMYQRVRTAEVQAPAKSAAPVASAAPLKTPARGSAMPAFSPPPPPVAPPSAPPAVEAKPQMGTQMIEYSAPPSAGPRPMMTEVIQWNGMLRCTGGPLEGETFAIEDDGVYIGRDASLSTIVVADNRISKRHVRIVPKNGKVWAIDQNSTNGTFLQSSGGQRITEVQLKSGDVLILGDSAATFVYQL